MFTIPRPEHPRPDFMRDTFENLNGNWQFAFDDTDKGISEKWYQPGKKLEKTILVPFCYQCEKSGLGPTDEIHPVLWYRRTFEVPESMAGQRIRLCFGAVDYRATVWVNGMCLGHHEGGYTPFSFDITPAIGGEKECDLCLRVEDYPDCTQPRGKQYWKQGLMGCWYTPVSGIWQTVYLEAMGENAILGARITPDFDRNQATVSLELERAENLTCEVRVSYQGEEYRSVMTNIRTKTADIALDMNPDGGLHSVHRWDPKHPNLYDVEVRLLKEGNVVDRVRTYFGMRKIQVRNGEIWLNNERLYQRLVLDQGYWPDTLLTPPSDEAIQQDIKMTLAFGYNGARKHQKIEDPRYYYWADKMGLLVWGELPSPYDFAPATIKNLGQMMNDFIARDFNHPCIITWVPLNESWGVRRIATDKRQQALARMLYQLTKAADGTRLVSANDGWEQVEGDICALHDYADNGTVMAKHFADREHVETTGCDFKACYAEGVKPNGQEAFIVTEYGGIAFENIGLQGRMGGMETWGYHGKVESEEAFFARFASVHEAVRNIPFCRGYCYTQLTDVMQEINGLMTPDRKPKMDPEKFAQYNQAPVGENP